MDPYPVKSREIAGFVIWGWRGGVGLRSAKGRGMSPLYFSVKRTHLCLQRSSREVLREHDLADLVTPAQVDVLRIVWERETVMRWQLVDLLGIVGPAVSKMLTRLEDRGLIERTKWEHDERYVEVKLTAAGEEVMRFAMSDMCRADNEDEYFDGIARADKEPLAELLLRARIRLGDDAKFVHPWMRVVTNMGYTLANPPPPEAIFPPREVPTYP